MNEGYIKYQCIWDKEAIEFDDEIFSLLESRRKQLFDLGLIGVYPDGIGYGNISVRNINCCFLITGSATGAFSQLTKEHYSLVNGFDIEGNKINCSGLFKASAESLTHAAIYKSIPEANAVVHVHSLKLWEKLLYLYPTTSLNVEYGTPQMAHEIGIIANEIKFNREKVIIMGGHKEGIISFGNNLDEATNSIIELYLKHINE